MSGKYFRFLDRVHNASRILGHIITWGGFLFIIIIATYVQGFPDGIILGLILGSVFVIISWLRFRNSHKEAVEARQKLQAFAQGQRNIFTPSKQQGYAIYGILGTTGLGILMMASCLFYSCKDDFIRSRLLLILIGVNVAIGHLFYKERVKGKAAVVALVILIIIVAFLIGKVFALW